MSDKRWYTALGSQSALNKGTVLLILLWTLMGFIANYVISYCWTYSLWGVVSGVSVAGMAVNVFFVMLIAARVVGCRESFGDYGFTLNWGCWLGLALIAGGTFIVLSYGDIVSGSVSLKLSFVVFNASVEELIFRVLLINSLIAVLVKRKRRVLIAILVSAFLFTSAHWPTKTVWQLQGILIMSVLFGYIYYWTRSILFPMGWHVYSNTVDDSGLVGVLMAVVIYFVIALYGRMLDHRRARVVPVGGETIYLG